MMMGGGEWGGRVDGGFLGTGVSLSGWEKSTEKVKLKVSENIFWSGC